jgi:hypothetical protein
MSWNTGRCNNKKDAYHQIPGCLQVRADSAAKANHGKESLAKNLGRGLDSVRPLSANPSDFLRAL